MKRIYKILFTFLLPAVVACNPSLPGESVAVDKVPAIYPEYADVTVPCNIAPLVFGIKEEGKSFVTKLSGGGKEFVVGGKEVSLPIAEWRELLDAGKGGCVSVEVYAKGDGGWLRFAPFEIKVSADSIDPYISYRLIPPSYVAYEDLRICQRNLSTFEESVIYCNRLVPAEPEGQCINCHAYKNYKTDNMQFHMRQHMGGTIFIHDGEVKKLNLKTDSTISAGVYPSFNPKYDIVAYSVNNTGQVFHTKNSNKVEVQDKASDVIVYNPAKETVAHVANSPDDLEVFPCWSADGRTIYYGSAHMERLDTSINWEGELVMRYKDIKYDILSREWNPETGEFGAVDTLFKATALGKSATFPRVSPCGRYMLFALAEYGCFHIWHKDADLYALDLRTKEYWPLERANSPFAESYHAWSSDGKWILFASRRDDTNYSRLYIARMNADGTAEKAFLLPQESAEFYDFFDRSYNVPEFMIEPVKFTPQEFAEVAKGESVNVKYSSNIK
ncbi:MAG: PD40 domain-containing protein [Bacteroidaceae bacterium]|nr:PD40 domain-containing protein [Bacteroidaceae bacterium]